MARCTGELRPWRRAGVWDRIMDALAAAHNAAVQMIDTSVVRVHQHGSCIAGNKEQHMGRSRGGLTSKIHAVVDANGLPVRLGLTPGEAHDNRLCAVLLIGLHPRTMLLADRGYDADWIRALASQQGAWANIARIRSASALTSTELVTWSSGSSTRSSIVGVSPPVTTSSQPTTLPSSSSHPSEFGCALMSSRPRLRIHTAR
jgi:transposase